MTNKQTTYRVGGLGILPVVGIVFVILKLAELVTWSWWWVLSPFLLMFGIWFLVVVLIFILATIALAAGMSSK